MDFLLRSNKRDFLPSTLHVHFKQHLLLATERPNL
jgi:hypothetical protein